MTLLAEYYDQIWNDLPDVEFLRKIFQGSSGPAVDLGCASGRVLEIALQAGLPVIGIDRDQDMIACAKDRLGDNPSVSLVCGDFTHLPFEGSAGVITCVANTFPMLIEPEDRARTINLAATKLMRGGKLILWIVNDLGPPLQPSSKQILTEHGPLIFHRTIVENRSGRMRTYTLDLRLNDRKQTLVVPTSLISAKEMRALIHSAGLSVKEMYGNFDGTPYSDNSALQIYVAEKLV